MITIDIVSSLRSFKLFQDLTSEELACVSKLCTLKDYQRHDYVFLQSDKVSHVFLQLQGRVKLYSASESGSEQTFMITGKGELFPHVGFFRNGNYQYHAVALTDASCLAIPIEAFKQLLITYPSIHFKITQVLADKILDLQQRLEDKVFYTVEGQLISLLLRLAQPHKCKNNSGDWCLLAPLTNSELAGLLGTTRETVNRIINKLKKHKALEVGDDGRIRICQNHLECMLPGHPNTITQSEKWSSICHHSNQCCISGGHEI